MSTIEKALEKLKGGPSGGIDDGDSQPDDAVVGKAPAQTQDELPGSTPEPQQQARGKASRRLNLDFERLAALGFLTPESGRTQLAEEMRHIKRPLVVNACSRSNGAAHNVNLIMVTSSKPSEGKTYTSLNLAMSIAKERDKTVLLVDADVAKPGVTRILGMEKEKGLVDYLVDESLDIPDVMLKTNVPNLRFIPAGKRHIHSTELLTSDRMKRLVQDFCTRYPDRIVVIDSPPLLATSEAAVLTGLVGQIVMVVEAEKTTQQEIEEALGLINEGASVGLVLNKARGSYGGESYGSYGAYGD